MTAGGCGGPPWGDEGVLKLNVMMVNTTCEYTLTN